MIEQNRKVLITGASGFLGSWISHHLNHQDLEVFAVSRPSDSMSRLSTLPKSCVYECVEQNWTSLIREISPNVVISADWSGVDSASKNSFDVQMPNIKRISALATASLESNVDTFLTFGSQAENGPINISSEEINYDYATTAYGRAKIEVRKLLEEKFQNSNTRFVWGRIFSTYGPLDNSTWLLPSLIQTLINNQSFNLTSGDQVWSYLHVYDFCTAITLLINSSQIRGVVNIGNEQTMKIREIAESVAESLGKQSLLNVGVSDYRIDQVMLLQPITAKLNSIGWKPVIDINDGLPDLVRWSLYGKGKYTIESLYGLI